jgi:hypothetical protein
MEYQKLNERYQETKMYKDRWLALYKDLYFYVIPDRDAFNVKWNYRDDGKPVTVQVWDNTAVLASYQRANDLHGLLLPKDRVWGKLILDEHTFDKEAIKANQPMMDEINDRIFFYINQSNLARVVSSSNLDLVGGTAGMWIESIDDVTPLYFRSIPAVCLYIEYSTDDVLNTAWYQCKFTGRQIRDNFPNYRGMKLAAIMNSPNDIFIVIYGQIKMSEDKYFLYAVMEDDPFTPLWETERSYPQMIIYRDRVRPGESDGRGVGVDMLPMIRDLNTTVQYRQKNLAFKANPPMFYDSNVYFNPYSIRQWSGAMIARNPQGRNPLEPLQMPEYPDVFKVIDDMRQFILKGFMVDPLGEIASPVKSATEISIRENRAQRSASSDIARLINELPRQIYEVSARILSERRLLTKDRSVTLRNTRRFKFDYQSPLYDLQKQDNLNHMVTSFQIMQQFFGAGSPMAVADLTKVKGYLREWLNLPSNIYISDEQLQQYLQVAAERAQQGALPTPSTAAAQVKLPPMTGVTV